jgi:DNA-binding Xre family transcriptional regulator
VIKLTKKRTPVLSPAEEIRERFIQSFVEISLKMNLTDKSLSEELGMYPAAMSKMRAGEDRYPQPEWMYEMCRLYSVNGHWLLTGDGEMFEDPILSERVKRIEKRIKDLTNAMKGN